MLVALVVQFAVASAFAPALADPRIVNGRNFVGLAANTAEPSAAADAVIAVGPTRVLQFVNERFAIYSRANTSTTPIATGSFNELTGSFAEQNNSPQVIWDPTTSRFYYAFAHQVFMPNPDGGIGGSYHTYLIWGWSRTGSPNAAVDFCPLSLNLGAVFPDSLTLGDSEHFILIGLQSGGSASLLAVGKPLAGSECSMPSPFPIASRELRDPYGNPVLAPVAANAVDPWAFGYAIARDFFVPSDKLWLFPVSRGTDGKPVIGAAKGVTLPVSYIAPPDAAQPGITQKIDTGEAELTQAVIARNPDRGGAFSLWTQHTVKNGSVSAVRWYEIDPFRRPAVVRRTGLISAAGTFIYNAAISPDRRVDGSARAFGGSFVIHFNRSSARLAPHIRTGSSVSGGPVSFAAVTSARAPFQDTTCLSEGAVCAWGDYSGAAPDPRPVSTAKGTGVVWGTNQIPGTSADAPAWQAQIFAVRP